MSIIPSADSIRVRPAYKDPVADGLAGLIYDYAANTNKARDVPEKLDAITRYLYEKMGENGSALTNSRGFGDFTLLIHALQLPFTEGFSDKRLRADKTIALLSTLLEFCRKQVKKHGITESEYVHFLTARTADNFSALDDAAISGSDVLYLMMADEIKKMRDTNPAFREIYARQYTTSTDNHFTLLLSAIKSGNVKIYKHVLEELRDIREHKEITAEQYAAQFTNINRDGFSLLRNAVMSGNKDIFGDVLGKLKEFHAAGTIDDETYANQFITISHGNYTILHDAAKAGNPDIFNAVLGELKAIRKMSGLSKTLGTDINKIYAAMFTRLTDKQLSPLDDAIISGNSLIFDAYLKELKAAVSAGGPVTPDEYQRLFTKTTEAGFTVFHDAAQADNPAILASLIAETKAVCDDKTLATLLTQPTQRNFTPMFDALISGNLDSYRMIVDEMKKLRASGALAPEPYARQFTLRSHGEYLPINNAVLSGNTALFKAFINDLADAFPEPIRRKKMQEQLLTHGGNGWNLYHNATKPQAGKNTPSPDLIMALHDTFHTWFGNGRLDRNPEAQGIIKKLCREKIDGIKPENTTLHPREIDRWLSWVLDARSTNHPDATGRQ